MPPPTPTVALLDLRRRFRILGLFVLCSMLSRADTGAGAGGETAVDLPQLPHSYRKSFDASRLTRRRRSIQHFLQVALKREGLRDCDALVDFLSPEGV